MPPSQRHKIVILTSEPLKETMAGPAIRAWEFARQLAAEHDVLLVTMNNVCELADATFRAATVGPAELRAALRWCEVLILQGAVMARAPWVQRTRAAVVVDLYDPFHLEVLEQLRDQPAGFRARAADFGRRELNAQLRRGDFFICASAKQRDFWLGQLAGQGRVNPVTYDADTSVRSLITEVPFGLPPDPPIATTRVLKGVVPGIGADDKVILWGGGVYNWFDPLSLLRAMHRLHQRRPSTRLFFLGMTHPNPEVEEMRIARETRELAASLGMTNSVVFFNDEWVPYAERHNYLLEADAGVSVHGDHVETAFSFRTRILDYFWAGLPVVATGGDSLAEVIEARGLGLTVAPGDEVALDHALERVLFDTDLRERAEQAIRQFATTMSWPVVVEPLRRFCLEPRRAPDLVNRPFLARAKDALALEGDRLRNEVGKAPLLLERGGPMLLGSKLIQRISRASGLRRG